MSRFAAETDLDQLITLRSGLDPAPAQLLKSTLESHGVPAYVVHDNMAALQPGVRAELLVREGDKERAESLLRDVHTLPQRPKLTSNTGVILDLACSQCGSSQVEPYSGEVPTFIPGVRMEARSEDGWYHCRTCGSYTRDKPTRYQSLPMGFIWALFMAGLTLAVIWLINTLRWL